MNQDPTNRILNTVFRESGTGASYLRALEERFCNQYHTIQNYQAENGRLRRRLYNYALRSQAEAKSESYRLMEMQADAYVQANNVETHESWLSSGIRCGCWLP